MVSDRKREVLLSLRKTGLPATTLLLIVGTISFVIDFDGLSQHAASGHLGPAVRV